MQSTYDLYGNQLTQASTASNGETITITHVYDPQNRLVETIDPEGNRTNTEYTALGKEAAQIDALGFRTEMAYDASGMLTAIRQPNGAEQRYV